MLRRLLKVAHCVTPPEKLMPDKVLGIEGFIRHQDVGLTKGVYSKVGTFVKYIGTVSSRYVL